MFTWFNFKLFGVLFFFYGVSLSDYPVSTYITLLGCAQRISSLPAHLLRRVPGSPLSSRMILQFITTGFLISSLHPWGSFAHASFVSGSIQRAHDNVLQHTRALTRDMRTSFDVIRKLISFPKGVAPKTFVIRRENSKGAFCTLGNQAVLRGSGSGPGVPRNGTSATPTGTTTAPHSTPTTIPPASPWKLFQSYV